MTTRDETNDIAVMQAEPEDAAGGWYAIEPSGNGLWFATEDAACDHQRIWRTANGLNADTGEAA